MSHICSKQNLPCPSSPTAHTPATATHTHILTLAWQSPALSLAAEENRPDSPSCHHLSPGIYVISLCSHCTVSSVK